MKLWNSKSRQSLPKMIDIEVHKMQELGKVYVMLFLILGGSRVRGRFFAEQVETRVEQRLLP